MNDFRYAFRQLLSKPGFTLVAVLTLALGIGANSAIFSGIRALLLRPLPFAEPERLVLLWGSNPGRGWPQLPTSQPNFIDIRQEAQSFAGMAAWAVGSFNLSGDGHPQRVQSAVVSDGFFGVFGVEPLMGRAFRPEEEKPGGARVALLSHQLWQDRFGRETNILGQTILLDGQSHEIVGVLPRGFTFASFPKETDVWLPLGNDPFQGRQFARGNRSLGVVARLNPQVSLDAAQTEMKVIAQRLQQQHPEFNTGLEFLLVPLHEQAVQNLRPALLVSLVAVGLVLFIACANVANLLLARAAGRNRELAIRSAVGATSGRLIRQLLVESMLLSLAGGLAGLLIGYWGIGLFQLMPAGTPSFFVPYDIRLHEIRMDSSVLLFTLALSTFTGLLFGLAPIARAFRSDLVAPLQEGSARTGRAASERRAGSALVVAEVALSMVLLIGAGLLAKSFLRLQQVDPGFRPENLLALDLSLSKSDYPDDAMVAGFYDQLLDRVKALPNVQNASVVVFTPLSGRDGSTQFFIEGQPPPAPGEKIHTAWRAVSPGHFQTMGIPIREGREFESQDRPSSARVALINETMARRFWPNENPIGKRVALDFESMRFFPDRPPEFDLSWGWREIVGIVDDVRHAGLDQLPQPEMYVPHAQRPVRDMTLVTRAESLPTSGLVEALHKEVLALDKNLPVSNVTTLIALFNASVAQPRFSSLLLGLFAGLAVALAAIGVYGVMSCLVSERTREIGVRMALGAKRADVLKMILGQSGALIAIGLGIGLVTALIVTRSLSHLLYGMSASDPSVFVAMPILLALVAVASALIPACRATRIDPMTALREE